MRDRGATKIKKWYRGATKIKKWYRGANKVWSGASMVSYYDGNTLLGVEEVDADTSVLHPDIDMTKSGYVHVGWKDSINGEFVEELLATGEPMAVYAIYVVDTIAVASGYINGRGTTNPSYAAASLNTSYVTGSIGSTPQIWYNPGTTGAQCDFVLNKKFYQKAQLTICMATHNICSSYFDGTGISDGYSAEIQNGAHRISIYATNEAEIGHGWAVNATGIASLVLSNPKVWE